MGGSEPRTRAAGWGPFPLPWEPKWRQQADTQATAELLRAYGSVNAEGQPVAISWGQRRGVGPDPASRELGPRPGADEVGTQSGSGSASRAVDAVLAEAERQAVLVEREARAKAAALEQDAERRHHEIFDAIEEKRNSLERKIEELRTFEREYRIRLRAHLLKQLEDVDSRDLQAEDEWRHAELARKELVSLFQDLLHDLETAGTRNPFED